MSDIQQSAQTQNATDYTDSASIEAALFNGEPETPELDDEDQAAAQEVENDADGEKDGQDVDDEAAQEDAEGKDDPDKEGQEAAEGDESEQVYTVKVDGKEFEVTETELLAGYQRQQDYTQKTQSIAEQRRAFEQERQGEMEQLRNALAYYALPTAKEPRPEDFAGQPDQFMQAYGQWQQQSARQAEAAQLLEAITAEESQRTLEREAGLLQQAIPEWADETVRQADYAKMMQAASDRYGFTQEEIAQVTDHRLLILLRDAAKGAELEAKPVVLKRKTEIKPKLSAGAKVKTDPNASKQKKAFGKLKSKGDLTGRDAEALLFTE